MSSEALRDGSGRAHPPRSSRSLIFTQEPMVTVLGQQPRYMQLAQTLVNEIQSGRFPVGSTIPTEFELCEQFGASRSTVREAVKQLVQLGMVVRQAMVLSYIDNFRILAFLCFLCVPSAFIFKRVRDAKPVEGAH